MTEEPVDTPEVPAESVEPTEPTEPQEPQESEAPAYITAEELQGALEKQDSSFRSWLGRRDKETLNHIGDVINERLSQTQETPDEVSTRLLENPRDVIRSEMEAYESERTQKQTTHLNMAMETVGTLMEADPLYQDKDLGNEVVEEIKQLVKTGKVDSNASPTQAGKIILADALSSVIRKRQGAKTNPLEKNTASGGGANLQAPAKTTVKLKAPKLDDVTTQWAKKWGYSEEDLSKLYGE